MLLVILLRYIRNHGLVTHPELFSLFYILGSMMAEPMSSAIFLSFIVVLRQGNALILLQLIKVSQQELLQSIAQYLCARPLLLALALGGFLLCVCILRPFFAYN